MTATLLSPGQRDSLYFSQGPGRRGPFLPLVGGERALTPQVPGQAEEKVGLATCVQGADPKPQTTLGSHSTRAIPIDLELSTK